MLGNKGCWGGKGKEEREGRGGEGEGVEVMVRRGGLKIFFLSGYVWRDWREGFGGGERV